MSQIHDRDFIAITEGKVDQKILKELSRLGNALVVLGSDFKAVVEKLEASTSPAKTTRQPLKAGRKTQYRSLIRTQVSSKRKSSSK